MHVQERAGGFAGLSLSQPGPRLSLTLELGSASLLKLTVFQSFRAPSQMEDIHALPWRSHQLPCLANEQMAADFFPGQPCRLDRHSLSSWATGERSCTLESHPLWRLPTSARAGSSSLLPQPCQVLPIPRHISGAHTCRENRPFEKRRTKEGTRETEMKEGEKKRSKQFRHPELLLYPGD